MPSLRKATEFVMDLVYPNYSVENFNDTRSGRMQKSMLIKNFTRYAQMFPDNEGMKWMATQGKEGKKPTYTLKHTNIPVITCYVMDGIKTLVKCPCSF